MEAASLKTAIIHDWLVTYAGADRLVDQLHQIFPNAPIYTLVYDKSKMPDWFKSYDIRTTYLQKIPFATKLYKNMLTLMPGAFECLDLTEFDLVISSCSSCSKGVITRPDAVHICYCNTPTRYLWDLYYAYLNNAGLVKRLLIPRMARKMRLWDRLAADRVDHFIANSVFTASRIRKYYRRDSDVIYPGVQINEYNPSNEPEDYYLMAGRFSYYKRFDLGVMACSALGRKLIVVGRGDEEKRLHKLAGPTVTFAGAVSDEELKRLYSKAKAFIFPGLEDFGITPVEAQGAGCPVLAYGKGGTLETVLDGKTGAFFAEQTVESLCDCIRRFERDGVAYTRSQIHRHSREFSQERFRKEILSFCEAKLRLLGRTLQTPKVLDESSPNTPSS